jgi:MinD-like ATPase involved in chromosome partitioning or flagellar assembly/CheY-like chemotaxis protein
MTAKKILVVDADAASRNFITTSLLQNNFAVLGTGSGKEGLIMAWRDRPDLIIIDPVLPDIKGEEMAAKLRQDSRLSGVTLIALSSDQSVIHVKACLGAGFNEFIPKTSQAIPTLLEIVDRLLGSDTPLAKEGGLLFSFLSAKGGIGTSSLCANFATSIALNQPEARVAVADLVLPIGSIAQIVGYKGEHNLITVSDLSPEQSGAEFFKRELQEIPIWRFYLLAGSPDPESSYHLKVARIGEVVSSLKSTYDYVLLDIGRSLSKFTLPLIQHADLAVLIMSTDLSSITLTKTLLDYLRAKSVGVPSIYPILNRAVGLEGLSKAEADKMLGLEIKITMPYLGSNFSLANNLHQPIIVKFPKDTASIVMKEAAQQMVELSKKLRV